MSRNKLPSIFWHSKRNYQKNWAERAEEASKYLPLDSRVVLDIGCGQQDLRSYLPKEVKYLPADLCRWTEETEYCDLNKNILPSVGLIKADTVFTLGLLEYIFEVESKLEIFSNFSQYIIGNYNPTDICNLSRNDWHNDYDVDSFLRMLSTSGYDVLDYKIFGHQILFIGKSRLFSASLENIKLKLINASDE